MNATQVIAQNITDLLNNAGEQLKDVHSRASNAGVQINYPMLTRLGSTRSVTQKNPSLETVEKVVEVLRFVPGYEGIELWMLLQPGYFQNKKAKPSNFEISERFMSQYVEELLFAITTMKIIPLDEKTYDSLKNVATFCYMNKLKGESEAAGKIDKAV